MILNFESIVAGTFNQCIPWARYLRISQVDRPNFHQTNLLRHFFSCFKKTIMDS